MRFPIACAIALAFCAVPVAADPPPQEGDQLGKSLAALNHLRRGKETPFASIDTEFESLLKEYPRAEDQGRIYAQIAHLYAQSGMRRPGDAQRVIDAAQEALRNPIEPRLRLRTYLYWGDAYARMDPTDFRRSYIAGRADAATAYLKGLKEAAQYHIPEVVQDLPRLSFPKKGEEKDLLRQLEARQPQLKRIQTDREMHMYRSCLQGQLLFLYTRRPYAGSELRRLATEILGDAGHVEKLMKTIPSEALKDETPPKPK